jgi:transcriptional regulator with XRE-family HTH domain
MSKQWIELSIDIPLQLSKLIDESELSVRELAKRIGTSHSQLHRYYQAGYDAHKVRTLAQIAEELGYELKVEFKKKGSL